MVEITSRSNSFLAHVRKLASSSGYRKETGQFLGDGVKLCQVGLEAIVEAVETTVSENGSDMKPSSVGLVETVVVTDESLTKLGKIPESVKIVTVPPHIMEWISPMKTPQGALFVGRIPESPENSELPEKKRFLVLEGVQDPGNVGTIWRTVQGLGGAGLILLENCASPWNPKTVRSSMGACFHVAVHSMKSESLLEFCKEKEIPLIGTSLEKDSLSLAEVSLEEGAVILGSEGQGISKELLSECEKKIYLPMHQGCESLNVATVASILLWEMGK